MKQLLTALKSEKPARFILSAAARVDHACFDCCAASILMCFRGVWYDAHDLLLHEFQPNPMLRVTEHRIERPRFSVIDAHNHLWDSWEKQNRRSAIARRAGQC